MKESPLRVIVGAEVYKAIMAKIEAYEESDRRFARLDDSTDVEGVRLFEMAGFYVFG